jgi:hypothetical protein
MIRKKEEEFPMKNSILFAALALGALSVALLSQPQSSNGNERPAASPRHNWEEALSCSNERLEGTYAINIGGTRPAPAPPSGTPNYVPGTIEQLIGVGTRTFDGDGNFSQITNEKGSLSGILFPNRALQGTYTVNPDCSGTLALNVPGLPFAIKYDFAVSNHGREFDSIVAFPPSVMVTTSGRKVR